MTKEKGKCEKQIVLNRGKKTGPLFDALKEQAEEACQPAASYVWELVRYALKTKGIGW